MEGWREGSEVGESRLPYEVGGAAWAGQERGALCLSQSGQEGSEDEDILKGQEEDGSRKEGSRSLDQNRSARSIRQRQVGRQPEAVSGRMLLWVRECLYGVWRRPAVEDLKTGH